MKTQYFQRYFKVLLCFFFFYQGAVLQAQLTVAIPDPNFEQKLIDLNIDSDGIINGQILQSDALSVSALNIDNSNINSLSGIEAFTNLNILRCESNNLTSLDLRNSKNMVNLYANNNNLTSLRVHSDINLGILHCRNSQLTYLDLSNAGTVTSLETYGNSSNLVVCLADMSNVQYYLYDQGTIFTQSCLQKRFTGRVYHEANNNCNLDPGEQGMQNRIIEFEKGGETWYFSSNDAAGNYNAYLDTGTYAVRVLTPYNYWFPCQPAQTVTVTNTVQTMDFGLVPTVSCPLLEVGVSAPFLRPTGGGSNYHVSYCNKGTAVANNAYVEVEIDPTLNVLGTSIPISSQTGNVYTFNIGNVAAGACNSFTINVVVDLNSHIGQTHCTEAHIYPDSICDPTIWTGARMVVTAECVNDSMQFTITNIGTAMTQALDYYVFEDNIMMYQSTYQLGAGQSTQVSYPANDSYTYRLTADQETGFPTILGDPFATAVFEGCNPAPDGSFHTGFVTQFSNGHSSPFIAIDCQPNIASFDPNDKAAQPVGYGAPHYVAPNTPLDYKIRFQNTGTDTAFNIVILDTISAHLDLGTIQLGASSHSYTWTIEPGNVLRMAFNNIMLPDSNVNEPASNGFFTYRISPKANTPLGTVVHNSASIYFDFNPPIKTNTTWHTLGQNFITIMLDVEELQASNTDVKVYPNPFTDVTTIELGGERYETVELTVVDLAGKEVKRVVGNDNKIELSRAGLQSGVYLYTLRTDNRLIHTGKIVVQ